MGTMKALLLSCVLAFAAAQSTTAPGGNGTTNCKSNKVDIVFLLDSSYSEGSTNFKKQLQFVENFTQAFDIGPDHAQVSVVVFSSNIYNAFNLNKYHDKASLLNAIQHISFHGGATYTNKALQYAREQSLLPQNGARYGVPKIVVVLTDGQSSQPSDTATQAKILHIAGIKVTSIGIGSGVKTTELQAIASDSAHVFNVASFDALHNIQLDLQNVACKSEVIACDNSNADIVFVLDASGSEGTTNFHKQVDFVSNFTNKFAIGPNSVQVSVVTFSTDVYNEFFLNAYGNKPALQAALRNVSYSGGTTHTDLALKFVRTNSFKPENGGRQSVPRLVVVLTDGNSISTTATKTEATLLHQTGAKVISIGIGSGISQTELNAIASDSRHVFSVANFNALGSIENEIQNAACTAPATCGTKPADIVFILDSSSSEGSANFKKQLDFVSNFVKQFDVGPSDVQFGMITFSSYAHSEFYLNTYSDKFALIAKIQTVTYRSGTTATDQGLRSARSYQFASYHGARANANHIAIVLTDGRSNDVSKTLTEATALKGAGVEVITVGVGAGINQYELGNMATDRGHSFTVGSFDILSTILEDIKDKTCGNGTVQPTISPDCGSQPADIIFVLDSSGSEGSTNFQKQLDFVRDFAYQFKIGPQDVQIGVVTFSTTIHPQFPLNRYSDQARLLSAISKIPYLSGTTYTDKALNYVRTTGFQPSQGGRANATDIVVVVTDGQSSQRDLTAKEAALLKNRPGTKVIAIGVGSGINHNELETIASDHTHAIAVADFNALQTIKQELTFVACQTCGFINKADIVFLLDASSSEGPNNFQKQLDFIARVANDFQIGPNHVQIGVVTFSDFPRNEFYLNTYSTKSSVLSAIQKIGYLTGLTNTDLALKFSRENSFAAKNGARDDAKNYLIVLTDGASANVNLTLAQADMLKRQNVIILAIGIGSNINKPEIEGMASDKKHAFEVSSFDALKTIRADIKLAACESVTTALPTTMAPTPTTTTTTTTTPVPTTTTTLAPTPPTTTEAIEETTTTDQVEVRDTTTTPMVEVRRTTTAPQVEVRRTTTAPQVEERRTTAPTTTTTQGQGQGQGQGP